LVSSIEYTVFGIFLNTKNTEYEYYMLIFSIERKSNQVIGKLSDI